MTGNTVRLMREARGWSQRVLAAHIQTPQCHISHIECGKTGISRIMRQRLLNVFDIRNLKNERGQNDA